MSNFAEQLAALERIAAFSAKLRGHTLGEWSVGEDSASAFCEMCKAEARVYRSLVQPEMDGEALEVECRGKGRGQPAGG